MGKSERTKGHSFERWLAREFRELGYEDARRHLEYQDGEANGYDLAGTGQIKVQAKAYKRMPNIPKAMALIEHGPDDIPMVISKIDRKGIYATIPWEDMKLLIKAWKIIFKDLSN
mgnify:CR=1 FL=1|jgi:hypothetical protein